jgi:protein gp37
MAENSLIAWTRNTFNPWMGCMKVSDGCKHCYAETLIKGRMGKPGLWGPASTSTRQVTSDANWRKPLAWNREAQLEGKAMRVFCASLADVFEDHPTANETRPRLWDIVRETPFLHWQILTKRPERIADNLPHDWGNGYANVWLGTSVESMKEKHRADILREIPASVRFISYEPALGPLDDLDLTRIDWSLYGGESGPGYRPHDLAWPRSMRDRCEASQRLTWDETSDYRGTTFFYKQSAAPRTEMGIHLDGELVRYYPVPRRCGHVLPDEVERAYCNAVAADRKEPFLDARAQARAGLPILEQGALDV